MKYLLMIAILLSGSVFCEDIVYVGVKMGSDFPSESKALLAIYNEEHRIYMEGGSDYANLWLECESDWNCVEGNVMNFAFRYSFFENEVSCWRYKDYEFRIRDVRNIGGNEIYIIDGYYIPNNWHGRTIFFSKESGVIAFISMKKDGVRYFTVTGTKGVLAARESEPSK